MSQSILMAEQGLKIGFPHSYSNDLLITLYIFNDYLLMRQNVFLKCNILFNFKVAINN